MKKIILISGKARHGKDTLATYLKNRLEANGNKVIIDRFAKYIKGYLREYYGLNCENKDDFVRSKLQWLGTERIKEDLNFKNFHTKRLAEDIQIIYDDFDYVIISDTRFRDELYYMKSMFPDECISVRVNRYDFISGLTEDQLKHKSECDLDNFNFDYTIHTRKSDVNQLYDEAFRVLGKILDLKETR